MVGQLLRNRFKNQRRLTKDPEIRYTKGEKAMAVARYTLAIDRRFGRKDGEQTADFIPCAAFGKAAEFAERYFHQGLKIAVTGRIQTGSYTNKEGNKISTTDVIVEEQEFADSKAAAEANGSNYSQKDGRPDPDDGFMNIPDGIDDELPFR